MIGDRDPRLPDPAIIAALRQAGRDAIRLARFHKVPAWVVDEHGNIVDAAARKPRRKRKPTTQAAPEGSASALSGSADEQAASAES